MVAADTAPVRQRSGAAIVAALKAEGVEHIFAIDVTCDYRFPPYDLAQAAAELG